MSQHNSCHSSAVLYHSLLSLLSPLTMDLDNLFDNSSEEEDVLIAITALVILGAEQGQQQHQEQRMHHRLYLCQPQLLPDPHHSMPWQILHLSQNDHAFITTMGFNCATFEMILAGGFQRIWDRMPIP